MLDLPRVLLAVILVLALAGCASPKPEPLPLPSPSPSPTPASGQGKLRGPGIVKLADGTSEAYGYVRHVELEGGFWALVADNVSQETSVVVVLLPGKVAEADIAKLAGSYAQAKGTELHGASIRMAGPEMKVDAIEALREPQ
jgi:hypothetical protein